jgi:hypothetical protein
MFANSVEENMWTQKRKCRMESEQITQRTLSRLSSSSCLK